MSELQEIGEGNDENEEGMDSMVLEVRALFIMHSDYERQKSALAHFFGVLGYNGRTKRWRELNTYPPIFAGVQFCIRVSVSEYALPLGERNELICMKRDDPTCDDPEESGGFLESANQLALGEINLI